MCREHLAQLRERESQWQQRGVAVVVVTFEAEWIARAYAAETGTHWPILVDRQRTLYAAYGLERGSWWRVLTPSAWWSYLGLLLRGRRLHRPTDDVRQLGGDVLVDPAGIVRWRYASRNPTDRPRVDDILAIVARETDRRDGGVHR
jgi:hypothetical protein